MTIIATLDRTELIDLLIDMAILAKESRDVAHGSPYFTAKAERLEGTAKKLRAALNAA